jgi:4-amino-4-deoxy-L-arabinose transferase-like glycosyltransferase
LRARPATLVFFVVLAVLALTHGNRLVLTNDEGILLDPAQQLAAGARPYLDFFGYMSPGSYWLQAAWFKVVGVSLWAGRLPVILNFALQCALLFWLTARLASQRTALAAVVIFAGFQVADPSFLTAQHRWDSATLALAGICATLRWTSPRGLLLSGALLAAAVWCTPSLALVGVAELLWLLAAPERRRWIGPFFAGILAISALAAGWLAIEGTLTAFVEQMLWLQRNYSSVNVMPYGSVMGGYARLLEDAAGLERILRILFVACMALPALLPPLALLLWGVAYSREKLPRELASAVLLLSLATVGFALSAFPRADLFHLAFVAAVPYALTAAALARLLSARAGAILAFAIVPIALLFSLNNFRGAFAVQSISSPVGRIRVPNDLLPDVTGLLAHVPPRQSMFVYPYLPICYFITQASNPTRFSYLSPGMMTAPEEAEALRELQARPPEWLMYMRLSDQEFRRVFPNAAESNIRFHALESWLESGYTELDSHGVNIAGYRLYHRSAAP